MYVKATKAAEMLDTTVGTLAQLRFRGQGPRWFKWGATGVRYKTEDLEAYMNERACGPGAGKLDRNAEVQHD